MNRQMSEIFSNIVVVLLLLFFVLNFRVFTQHASQNGIVCWKITVAARFINTYVLLYTIHNSTLISTKRYRTVNLCVCVCVLTQKLIAIFNRFVLSHCPMPDAYEVRAWKIFVNIFRSLLTVFGEIGIHCHSLD